MEHLPVHTLLLFSVFLHSCAGADCLYEVKVLAGEKATIRCYSPESEQRGVYMYRQQNKTKEDVLYYYQQGDTRTVTLYRCKDRLDVNKDMGNFSVSISNVSREDSGVYWCRFNMLDQYTFSPFVCLLVQSDSTTVLEPPQICTEEPPQICTEEPPQICTEEPKPKPGLGTELNRIYLGVIIGLTLIILVLVAVLCKMCHERGNYTPPQQPSDGVYEVMHGTTKAIDNPAYESSQRLTLPDLI